MDYRHRAVEYKDEGHTFRELKAVFKVSSATYYDWKKKIESGYYEQPKTVERKRLIDKEQLKKAVEEKPDAYLREFAEPLGEPPDGDA
jgi:transposase